MIKLEKTMPNRSVALTHELGSISIVKKNVTVIVTSYPEGSTVPCWQDNVFIPYEQITGDPEAAVIAALTAKGGYLEGGTDEADPTPLEDAKKALLAQLTRIRDAKLLGGCTTPFGAIDTDLTSRANISGSVSMAMLAMQSEKEFNVTWRMQDNAYVELDTAKMLAVGVVVGQFVANVYAKSFEVKDLIDKAEDIATLSAIQLNAIVWPA